MKSPDLKMLLLIAPMIAAVPAHAGNWFPCGNITQIGWSCQLTAYPSSQYDYGIAYNTAEPLTVTCSYWNYGMRISNRLPYHVWSDNPSTNTRWGGFMFYTSTLASDDDTCSGGSWRHRYWWMDNGNLVLTGSSNGCYGSNLTIFCRSK